MAFLRRVRNRSSLRTWLYRIATNACLTALRHRNRRVLRSGLCVLTDEPYTEPIATGPEAAWLQPVPDDAAAAKRALQGARRDDEGGCPTRSETDLTALGRCSSSTTPRGLRK